MTYHPDVLSAHAQFGGDLDAMQALYDRPDHLARIADLQRQLAEAQVKIDVQRESKEYAQRCCESAEAERDRLAAENERLKGVVRKSLDAINATEKLADIQRGGYSRPEQEAVLHLIVEQFLDARRAALAGKAGEA